MSLMSQWVYTPQAVRELDRHAIEKQGVPGYELMTRAGQATFNAIGERYPQSQHWLILCGGGNNAGDGYVIARLAQQAGMRVEVLALTSPDTLTGDAATAYAESLAAGVVAERWSGALNIQNVDLIVDALLGTGLVRPLAGEYQAAVVAVNGSRLPVIAVDIPTGLNGLTGEVMGAALQADLTVTYIGLKQGLFLAAGPDHCGELLFADLGIAPVPTDVVKPALRVCETADLRLFTPRRSRAAHKGHFGHVLIVGGNTGMGGAVRLAGEAALRTGAGLVSVATRPVNVPAVIAGRPELMCRGIEHAKDLDALLARATVVVIGPGLGTDDWAQTLLARVLATALPLVVDADALNLLADQPSSRDNWILTPHPGEAGRLLGIPTLDVQANRLKTLADLKLRFGGTVLLKGHGTLVSADSQLPWLVRGGNPGMATAGMGDVLSGIIAGLLAQYPTAEPASLTAAAALAHVMAADRAAKAGERGMVASDLFGELRACLNQ